MFFVVLEYQVSQLHRVALPALISMLQRYNFFLKYTNIFAIILSIFTKTFTISLHPVVEITQSRSNIFSIAVEKEKSPDARASGLTCLS